MSFLSRETKMQVKGRQDKTRQDKTRTRQEQDKNKTLHSPNVKKLFYVFNLGDDDNK